MAILKDTTILGDARVTDTLYANELNGETLQTDHLVLNTNSNTASIEQNQLEFLSSSDISYAKVISNTTGMLGLFSKRIIGVFPGDAQGAAVSVGATNDYQSTDGLYLYTDMIKPIKTNTMSLGEASAKWSDIYATTLHGALTLSEITGADDLKAIEALSGTSGLLKKTAANAWTLDTTTYSTLTLGTTAGAALAATASAGTATTAAKSDHVHPFPTAAQVGAATSDHIHGNITNGGCITTAITVADGDYLIIGDTSDSGKLGKGPAFVATTANKFLKDTGAFTALAAADLPDATTSAKGAVIVGTGLGVSSGTISVAYGTTADTACEGNDSRLSDARTPTAHSHGIIDNDGVLKNPSNSSILANCIPYSNTNGELATTADLVYTYSNRTLYSRILAAAYYSNSANNTGYGINFIDTSNSDAIMAHIGASASGLGIYHGSSIYIRPALTGATAGIVINSSSIIPSTHAAESSTANAMSLGITTNQWTSVFAKQYTVDTHVTLVYNSSDLSLNFNFS